MNNWKLLTLANLICIQSGEETYSIDLIDDVCADKRNKIMFPFGAAFWFDEVATDETFCFNYLEILLSNTIIFGSFNPNKSKISKTFLQMYVEEARRFYSFTLELIWRVCSKAKMRVFSFISVKCKQSFDERLTQRIQMKVVNVISVLCYVLYGVDSQCLF